MMTIEQALIMLHAKRDLLEYKKLWFSFITKIKIKLLNKIIKDIESFEQPEKYWHIK